MRSILPGIVFTALTAVFTVAACASTEEVPPPQNTEPAPQPSAMPASTQKPAEEPPAKKCVAKCKADSECANSCPVITSGVHCCDLKSGACYVNGSGVCPKPEEETDPPPAY